MELSLSSKDFAAIKAIADHEQQSDIEYSKIIRQKIDLLLELVHTLFEEQVKMNEYLKWSEPILIKLSFHSYTLIDVFSGTDLVHNGITHKVFDEPSVFILLRTILENYLTFFYLFVDDISEDEKLFRSNVFRYSGLKQRTSFEVSSEDAKLKQAKELMQVEELRNALIASQYFLCLNNDEKKQVLKGVKPRLINSWAKLIKISGFREELFKNIYGYKSNYTHSEFISILQINSKTYGLDASHKEHLSLFLLHILICKTIVELSEVFPSIKMNFDKKNELLKNEVDFFYQFATNKQINTIKP